MSLIIAGGIFGSILIYQNSDYIILNSLKAYSYIQNQYEKISFLEEKNDNPEKININNKTLFIYKNNNKEFYSWSNNIKDDTLISISELINPIMDITLKINNEIINFDIISKFIYLDEIHLNRNTLENIWIPLLNKIKNKNVNLNKKDKISWEILDTDFNTYNGEDIILKFKNKLIVINN